MEELHVDTVMSLSDDIGGLSTGQEESDEHGYSPPQNMSLDDEEGNPHANGRDNKRRRSKPKNENRRRVYVSSAGAPDASLEVSSRLLLPASRIGGVIGRGGDVIKNIREMSGARINIAASGSDERDSNFRMVTVSGMMGAVCHAVQMVAAQAGLFDTLPRGGRHRDQGMGQAEDGDAAAPLSPQQQLDPGLRLVIDAAAAGQLIGKKGATISEIRMQSGARIQVVGEDESAEEGGLPEERVVLVLGSTEPCLTAHRLITAVLAAEPGGAGRAMHGSLMPQAYGGHHSNMHGYSGNRNSMGGANSPIDDQEEESCQVIMRVSNDKIGRVIGKEGATINKIRQESQCKIEIENSRPGESSMRVIRIRGNMQQTQIAQQLVTQRMTATP